MVNKDEQHYSDGDLLPVLPLKDMVIFPNTVYPVIIGRELSVNAVQNASLNENRVLLLTQKDPEKDDIIGRDLNRVGVVAHIVQMTKLPNGLIKILIEGLYRARLTRIHNRKSFFDAKVETYGNFTAFTNENLAELRVLKDKFKEYVKLNRNIADEIGVSVDQIHDNYHILNYIIAHLDVPVKEKQKFLDFPELPAQLQFLHDALTNEIAINTMQVDVNDRVKDHFVKAQKAQFIREQIRLLKEELGEDEENKTINALRQRIIDAKMPAEIAEKAFEELDKLDLMSGFSPEATVVRNYLDWLIDVPWHNRSETNIEITRAKEQLDSDHYGLKEVKERILDYLAVLKRNENQKGPIMCLVGPPGVGKTSLGKSIADSMQREFVRISLGGVRDEAEIRGHRKTYIGAMPGKIIQAMKKAKTVNPVILLDEIDKMASDMRGDPASALLEVLDPEQNHTFVDHFIEVEYDLSKVLFLATANYFEGIPAPLLDRMEVLELNSYIETEKTQIAKRFLLPKAIEDHHITDKFVEWDDDIVRYMIRNYTREAGVRQLKQVIHKVIRKITRYFVEHTEAEEYFITLETLHTFLGKPKYKEQAYKTSSHTGVAIGMAWTASGGDLLPIEVTVMKGKEKFVLTGKLGDVMKESAQTALSYIRSHADLFDVDPDFFASHEIHIHVPEGAVPKDGPSAGITITSAILSALKNQPLKKISMTGEITLRGHVLAIGGLKEKLMSALRFGIKEAIIPFENENDYYEIDEEIRSQFTIHLVKNYSEVARIHHILRKEAVNV